MSSTNFIFGKPSEEVGHLGTAAMETGAAASGYPATNINNWSIGYEILPSIGSATATATAWVIDFGSARRVDWVVLWHNFVGSVAARIQMNAANSWGSPTVDAALTVPAVQGDGFHVKLPKDLTAVSGYSTSGLRYLRVYVPAMTGVAPGIKILCYSRGQQLEVNVQAEPHSPYTIRNLVLPTDAGYEWVYNLYASREGFSGTVLATNSDLATVRDWFQSSLGNGLITAFTLDSVRAMIMRWKPQGTSGLVTAQIDPVLYIKNARPRRHSIKLEFEDLTSGSPEWT